MPSRPLGLWACLLFVACVPTAPTPTPPSCESLACEPGTRCNDGACVPGCTTEAPCAAGSSCCEGQCFAVSADVDHCGACGGCAAPAHGVASCVAGECQVSRCEGVNADCNASFSDGCEVDLSRDLQHCGDCATACAASPGSLVICVGGTCGFGGCLPSFGDCDLNLTNGCEVALSSDAAHCGTCGHACEVLPHAVVGCAAGACGIERCEVGWGDCDQQPANGCETHLAEDSASCGTCGQLCPVPGNGSPLCHDGACGAGSCSAPFADCDATAANGCEVNLRNDALHCGLCSITCPTPAHASAGCDGFACGLGACATGFDNCSGGAADGCETSLFTDVDHCGDCSTVCPSVANGTRACVGGTCGIASCAAGFQDCDGQLATGCEVQTTADVLHCGSCSGACALPPSATASCVSGTCGLGPCTPGKANCDGNASNGCELDVTTDAANCGGCGVRCGSGTCASGACVCARTVLVIGDGSTTGTAALAAALTAAGYTVTLSALPSYQYAGTPAIAGFGAVVLLAGSSGSSVTVDMPAAGQVALVNAVASGVGLVLTEWAANHVASGRWQTLAPLVLLNRTVAYSGQVTMTVETAFSTHPIWAGVPSTFTFASTSNVGLARVAPGVVRLATSPQALDPVVIRDGPSGRVVHFSHAGNYAPNGWTNSNITRLVANAAGWAARCN